ncbi:BON domain-containing protein [Curtobacterium sp. NPDC098951]|uniref:BON domain-containing protein n=1 Tax=unclassified Curtobacterium TaxID=257496 RepID=UPI00380C36EB
MTGAGRDRDRIDTPVGPPVVPAAVRDRVLGAWAAERSLDASSLDAALRDGRLVLSGDVGCHSDRVTALALAAQADPMHRIENRIVVRAYACDPEETDADVRTRVAHAVALVAPSTAVSVDVLDHVVTISGSVVTDAERRAVHAAAARCGGVHFVVDHLSADPITS